MTCHNRVALTQRILHQIVDFGSKYFNFEIVIVDDGSVDGTSEMLAEFKKINEKDFLVTIIQGAGNWYWSKSMQIAQLNVSQKAGALLWLNDDVDLYEDSFSTLNHFIDLYPECVLVGQCYDPVRQRESFGGFENSSRNPLKLTRKTAIDSIESIDTFCGNFVYIPSRISALVGTVDGEFQHGHGDLDYGYRVTKSGENAYCLPGFIGECSKDEEPELLNRRQALAYWNSRKKSPIRSQIRFLRRHDGIFWPIWFVTPYLRIIVQGRKTRLDKGL
jgi:GT2 family glycosyltransferase